MLIIFLIIIGLAGICEAIMDKIQFHYHTSVFKKFNSKFWNPQESWINKYKENTTKPKFIGSTTIFVAFTDAWHLFKLFRNVLIFTSLPIIGYLSITLFSLIINIFIARMIYGLFFTLFFKIFNS